MAKKIATEIGALKLAADVTIPEVAVGVAIFAHGSGSSRLSPRNIHVADRLNRAGFATVLFDLLTEEEAADRANVFDVPLLGGRMSQAVVFAGARPELNRLPIGLFGLVFAGARPELNRLPIGLFGASTGAAAALLAAAKHGRTIAAVVSRGGRPDLALDHLGQVRAPTLLIVGGYDEPVMEMNQTAQPHCAAKSAWRSFPERRIC